MAMCYWVLVGAIQMGRCAVPAVSRGLLLLRGEAPNGEPWKQFPAGHWPRLESGVSPRDMYQRGTVPASFPQGQRVQEASARSRCSTPKRRNET